MPKYSYIGRDRRGIKVSGVRNAESMDQLVALLRRELIVVIELNDHRQQLSFRDRLTQIFNHFAHRITVPREELQIFCRQMYTLTKSGTPLAAALSKMQEASRNFAFKTVLGVLIDGINNGRRLSLVMQQYPGIFSRLFVHLVEIGEESGRLDKVFSHLNSYIELEIKMQRSILAAARYPIIVASFIVFAILLVNIFVIPIFAAQFVRFGADLPIFTKILIYSSNAMINYWHILLIAILVLAIAVIAVLSTRRGRWHWDRLLLKMPVFGFIFERLIYAKLAYLLHLLLASGLTMNDGLNLIKNALGNRYIETKVAEVQRHIEQGDSVYMAFDRVQVFPGLMTQMIAVGEEAGTLDELLLNIGEFYDKEVAYDIDRVMTLIEPILLLIVALLVLVLALGIFMPLWELPTLLSKR